MEEKNRRKRKQGKVLTFVQHGNGVMVPASPCDDGQKNLALLDILIGDQKREIVLKVLDLQTSKAFTDKKGCEFHSYHCPHEFDEDDGAVIEEGRVKVMIKEIRRRKRSLSF